MTGAQRRDKLTHRRIRAVCDCMQYSHCRIPATLLDIDQRSTAHAGPLGECLQSESGGEPGPGNLDPQCGEIRRRWGFGHEN